jgi:hypothetical protein
MVAPHVFFFEIPQVSMQGEKKPAILPYSPVSGYRDNRLHLNPSDPPH